MQLHTACQNLVCQKQQHTRDMVLLATDTWDAPLPRRLSGVPCVSGASSSLLPLSMSLSSPCVVE